MIPPSDSEAHAVEKEYSLLKRTTGGENTFKAEARLDSCKSH